MGFRQEQVGDLINEYSDLPFEVVYKEDLLRTGVSFSEDALRIASGFQPKAYFIFSFDLVPIDDMPNREHFRVPEEICLQGGRNHFRRVIVSVRVNPVSPYRVEVSREGRLILALENEEVCDVIFPEAPGYYGSVTSNGKPISDIAPVIEWGYLLYLTVFRLCQYFGRQEECQFCDINENYRQQKRSGRVYSGVKSVGEILEALEIVQESKSNSQAYTITGGSVTSEILGQSEVEFYAQYPRAIEEKFPGRWISKLGVQALSRSDLQLFKEAGVQIYHPNYEVWDPKLFTILCPGKDRYIGRDRWITRVLKAAEVFGSAHVIPNFVAGIEMSQPYGFRHWNEAVDSTAEGISFFMSHSIVPRFTTWCPEPLSSLGATNRQGAPLEYHVSLLRTWRNLLESFGLPAPPGYGEAGIGRAVFSVSSFMDVICDKREGPAKLTEEERIL